MTYGSQLYGETTSGGDEEDSTDSGPACQNPVTEELASGLPEPFPAHPTSGNYKLICTIGRQFEQEVENIDSLSAASSVQDAETIDQLTELGKLVGVLPLENESLDRYRARVVIGFIKVTNEATINGILNALAVSLKLDSPEPIGYAEPSGGEHGTVELSFPLSVFDDIDLTPQELAQIIDDELLAAGYRIEALSRGTFTYISPEDYQVDDFDATKGYDGLDANGDPKDNGGTYAGVIG